MMPIDIDDLYRLHSRRIFASLVRVTQDFDLAEDALHEAFRAAVEQWSVSGEPSNPVSWLIRTGRNKAIDAIRRRSRLTAFSGEELAAETISDDDFGAVEDERLRLIFTCCHPALAPDAQIALTLREVCGLTTEVIARAFLTPAPTLAQRIVRAKQKIRDARIPYAVPEAEDLTIRLDSVLKVVYLVFNQGYSTSGPDDSAGGLLAAEAIRLARLLLELLPEPEVQGLLALMLLHESRRQARCDKDGDWIPLDEQDRGLWDRSMIEEGSQLVEASLQTRRAGPYTVQAAISAIHADAPSYQETDWTEIVGLYRVLLSLHRSPIVELNMAVALGMRDGPRSVLATVEELTSRPELSSYPWAHAALADLHKRMGEPEKSIDFYERAKSLSTSEQDRRFYTRRMRELEKVTV